MNEASAGVIVSASHLGKAIAGRQILQDVSASVAAGSVVGVRR